MALVRLVWYIFMRLIISNRHRNIFLWKMCLCIIFFGHSSVPCNLTRCFFSSSSWFQYFNIHSSQEAKTFQFSKQFLLLIDERNFPFFPYSLLENLNEYYQLSFARCLSHELLVIIQKMSGPTKHREEKWWIRRSGLYVIHCRDKSIIYNPSLERAKVKAIKIPLTSFQFK